MNLYPVGKWLLLLALMCFCATSTNASSVLLPQRLRYIIETDAGGDPDDEQSLVRFLLYANEWDIKGIIANRPTARDGENLNPERTGLGIVRRLIAAYGQCYTNLVQNDSKYPSPEYLLSRSVCGYDGCEEAVNLIIAALEQNDPRPVWYSNWGTDHGSSQSCLKRALDRVLRDRGQAAYAQLKSRVRLSSANAFGDHTTSLAPPWALWIDTFRPELKGRRWYHRFSALTAQAGGFDLQRDVLTGHGPLGALYPTNTTHWQKEGDSMSFIYLIPTGLNDPEEPRWGSWAGRYGLQDNSGNAWYWANQLDAWRGSTNRDNTLLRWAVHLQNDFRARLDWCVKPAGRANHPPRVILDTSNGASMIRLKAAAGTDVTLDAGSSFDPDGNPLTFEWFNYPEAGTYQGPAQLAGFGSRATLRIPSDAAGQVLHVVVAVTDSGSPQLTRYGRAVIHVPDPRASLQRLEVFFNPPPQFLNQFGTYRSVLLFHDGAEVKTAADWPRRRKEILDDWNRLLGPWPAILQNPKFEVLSSAQRDGLCQQRVRIEIAPEQTSTGWLLKPAGHGPHPAVLVVYYEPETSIGWGKEPLRDFGLELAKAGFVTLSIGTPGGDAWKPETGTAKCQPLSFHAYVAANCWQMLAHLPEVDRERIGIVGHSYGGKWALFGAALWEKFAAVAVSDPGVVFDETRANVNYWEPWYLGQDDKLRRIPGIPTQDNPRTGAYRLLVEQGHNLHELHALIAPRPFFVSGGSEDPPERWQALNHLVRLNALLGHTNRVAMTNRRAHPPTTQSNEQLYTFFEHFLKP